MPAIDNSSGSELIIGRYRILYPLQEGGFGQTFLVEDIHLPSQRRCVLKRLKPVQDNPGFYKLIQDRFQREAAIQETLGEACQHIPRLYAYFSEGEQFYLVEEWIDGDTLSQKVAEVGRFSEIAVIEILKQLLLTIDTVHQHQIIHRDIKPDNIILRRRDGIPVLIDFGAVKESMGTVVDAQGASGRSIVIGTESYMPPEQSTGRPLYASDLFSLGLTAVYLLTGRSPAELYHDPQTGKVEWRSQSPQVSVDLAKVIDTAIQTHPKDRYASAPEMLQALQNIQPGTLLEDIPTLISQPQLGKTSVPNVISQSPGSQPPAPQTPVVQSPEFQPPATPNPPIPIPQIPVPPIPISPVPQGQPQSQALQPPIAQDQPQPQPYSSADLTVVSGRQEPPVNAPQSLVNTQVVSPAASFSSAHPQTSPPSGNKDWLKAALIGGGVGGGLLIGILLIRSQPSVVSPSPSTSPSAISSVSPSASPTPTSVENSSSPSVEPAPASTAQETCGDVGGNGDWYPVFINNADLAEVRRKYCKDAISKTRDSGTPAVQVASFTNQQRALDFADRVGGEVGLPYRVGSPTPSNAPSVTPTPDKPNNPNSDTNAVIIGDSSSKNIRNGPGSKYPVQHIAYPGDRVQITGSEQDSGGYIWYRSISQNLARQAGLQGNSYSLIRTQLSPLTELSRPAS